MGIDREFQWRCQHEAAQLVSKWTDSLLVGLPFAARLKARMLDETGTRLVDWLDHLVVPECQESEESLNRTGFQVTKEEVDVTGNDKCRQWQHPGGLFPVVLTSRRDQSTLAIKVESVADFLAAHQLEAEITGQPMSPLRAATVATDGNNRLCVIERHGSRDFVAHAVPTERIVAALDHAERLRRRRRCFPSDQEGFEHAAELFDRAAMDVGRDWACDLFFAAEREFWQSRNRAARIQKARQDRLGLGWANHDHHTYRSSRENFASLIALLERMGFHCRERFYGGAEAGWGAQVLEQPHTGVVIFADVDLSPQEVTGDFAHEGLPPRRELGTVGLWCAMHGEAMLQAGLHHLECQFAFDAARSQLADAGIVTMSPFTDFEFLKQAFTEGEVWQVAPNRINAALQRGAITDAQAERFQQQGAIGSHLEILQRDDGYKGFNQTGISEIIRETDPRHLSEASGV